MDKVIIYTDGACSGNPGPGGWGAILMYKEHKKELSGGCKNTTNNMNHAIGSSFLLTEYSILARDFLNLYPTAYSTKTN